MTKKTVRGVMKKIIEFMLPLIIAVKRSVSLRKAFDFLCVPNDCTPQVSSSLHKLMCCL